MNDPSLSADEVLTTTRAVRKRLDFERPVPRQLLLECLEIAVQAPTGSNRQGWQFVFVSDPPKKRVIADYYGRSFDAYASQAPPTYPDGDVRAKRSGAVATSSQYLRERMHEAPWLLIPCITGRPPEGAPTAVQASLYGSVLPAFWSFMLAARARGLGTAWTTLHLPFEHEVADLLNIPFDRVTQAGLTPVAYYTGAGFKPAPRIPLDDITHWESW